MTHHNQTKELTTWFLNIIQSNDRTTDSGNMCLLSCLGRRLALFSLQVDCLEEALDRLHGFT
jgi:hypothetical protein